MTSQKQLLADARQIHSAGETFEKLSAGYKRDMLDDGSSHPFPSASTGDGNTDRILSTVLQLAVVVKDEIAQSMENHGLKLKLSSATYIAAEQNNTGKIQSVTQLFESAENRAIPGQSLPPNK
jgi:hypothetical protein